MTDQVTELIIAPAPPTVALSLNITSEPLRPIIDADALFRLNNQRLFLTYSRCNFDRDIYRSWFFEQFGKTYINIEIYIAYELHQDGSDHRHVLLNFGRAFQSRNCRVFDYYTQSTTFHPFIRKVAKSPEDWANLMLYMSKVDPSLLPLRARANNYLNIVTSESLGHAVLRSGVSPMDTRIIYESRHRFNFVLDPVPEPDTPWYTLVKQYQRGEIDNYDKFRDLIWIYDQSGTSDKTKFAKWAFDNNDYCVVSHISRVIDFLNHIDDSVKSGWTSKYIVIDIPRSYNDDPKALYQCIEIVKAGIIAKSKYETAKFRIRDDVMIIVLANHMPKTFEVTINRWHIWSVLSNKSILRLHVSDQQRPVSLQIMERGFHSPPLNTEGAMTLEEMGFNNIPVVKD